MLGGVAAWLRWRAKRKAEGKPFDKPNLVMSSAFQVVWEKFCQLWQIEMRTVPLTLEKPTLDPKDALAMCDENTICIVPIAGVTWTGLNDDIEALDRELDAYNKKYLPEEMSFSVNYLGANITQVGLNFSRPAAQILGQYYNFIRLGFDGYKEVQQNSMDVACYCHEQIGKMKCFENYSKELQNPLFIWYMNPEYDKTAKWTLYDLQAVLQQSGWMVPAYTMPKNIDSLVVMRVVVRQGMSRDMADMLLSDIGNAVAGFEKLKYPTQSRLDYEAKVKQKGRVFTH